MIAVWESDISATFLIFRLKCSTDAAFFKFLGKLFHSMAPSRFGTRLGVQVRDFSACFGNFTK